MKNRIRKTFVWIALAAALAACAPAAPARTPAAPTSAPPTASATATADLSIRLTDGLGAEIVLGGPPARVVSLGPSNTEILYAIGAQDLLAGCDQFSDYPEAAKPLATISAGYGTLDTESIKALEPDLVLAAEIISAEQVQALRALGLTVYYVANPESLPDGLYANIRSIGALTGRSSAAEELVAALQARFQAVAEKTAAAESRPLVYFELDGTDPAQPYTAGPGSFIDMLIGSAGGRNLGESLTSSWAQISAEEILLQDPDVILLGDTGFGVTAESLAARPGWGNLKAVRNGAVYPVDSNLVLRPGPRLIDGLEIIASRIHPELFASA
jgi:iron complex transport system substrate-binding protein